MHAQVRKRTSVLFSKYLAMSMTNHRNLMYIVRSKNYLLRLKIANKQAVKDLPKIVATVRER